MFELKYFGNWIYIAKAGICFQPPVLTRICVSSTFTSRTGSQERLKRSENFDISYYSLANSTVVLMIASLLLSSLTDLSPGSKGGKHHLVENGNLQFLPWAILGKRYMQRELQRKLPSLSLMPEDRVQTLIMNRSGDSGVARALKNLSN